MYRPCLHCEGKAYDPDYCPEICQYGEDRKRLKELEEAAAAPAPQAPWIPVTERLPKFDTKVLVSVRGRDESLIGWYDTDWGDWIVEENLSEQKLLPVTHWQEKARPAKEDEE